MYMHILVYSGHKVMEDSCVYIVMQDHSITNRCIYMYMYIHTCIIIHVHVQIGVYILSKRIVCEGVSQDYKCVMLRSFCCCWEHSLELVV